MRALRGSGPPERRLAELGHSPLVSPPIIFKDRPCPNEGPLGSVAFVGEGVAGGNIVPHHLFVLPGLIA